MCPYTLLIWLYCGDVNGYPGYILITLCTQGIFTHYIQDLYIHVCILEGEGLQFFVHFLFFYKLECFKHLYIVVAEGNGKVSGDTSISHRIFVDRATFEDVLNSKVLVTYIALGFRFLTNKISMRQSCVS